MEIPTPPSNSRRPQDMGIAVAAIAAGLFIGGSRGGIISILVWLASMPFHEVGHALVYWLSGRIAIPSFGATLPLQESRSILTCLALATLLPWGHRKAKAAKLFACSLLCAVLAALCPIFTLIIPFRAVEACVLYAGLGGELYLAVLAIVLFLEPMPRRFAWDRNRYLFLILGAASFGNSLLRWYRAQRDSSNLPMGALFDFGGLFGDGNESSGDLDRLIREFGWSTQGIISVYTYTALVSIGLLIAYFFLQAYLNFYRLPDEQPVEQDK